MTLRNRSNIKRVISLADTIDNAMWTEKNPEADISMMMLNEKPIPSTQVGGWPLHCLLLLQVTCVFPCKLNPGLHWYLMTVPQLYGPCAGN